MPLYRALCSNGPGKDVLKRVKRMEFVSPGLKSVFFKLRTVYTVSRNLQVEGKGALSATGVPFVNNLKLWSMSFFNCWAAVSLWDVLQRTFW